MKKTVDAVLLDSNEINYYINTEFCGRLNVLGEPINTNGLVIFLERKFPLTSSFNRAVSEALEEGKDDELQRIIQGDTRCIYDDDNDTFNQEDSLQLNDLLSLSIPSGLVLLPVVLHLLRVRYERRRRRIDPEFQTVRDYTEYVGNLI